MSSPSPDEASAPSTTATERVLPRCPEPDGGTHVRGPDVDLVQRMQERDPHAFELVYDRHSAAALGLAHRMVGERGLAEDVTQEAFVSVWRGAGNYRPERGSVRTWILGITRNRAIDALRRRSSQARIRDTAEACANWAGEPTPTEAEAERRDEADSVRGAIVELPHDQRRVIELAYFSGLSHTEIAGTLQLPLGTVKGRMRLALDKLRRVVGPKPGTP